MTNNKEDLFDKIQTISRKLQTEKHPRSVLARLLTELVTTERESAEKGQYVEGHHDGWKEGRQQAYAEVRGMINVDELAERIVIDYANRSGRDDNRPDVREASREVLIDLLTKLDEKKEGI